MRDKKLTIQLPAFIYKLHVIMTDDVVGARLKLDGLLGEYDGDAVIAMLAYDDNNFDEAFVILPHQAKPGTIAHEAFHCVRRIFECMNAEMEEEIFAYTLEYIVNQIFKLQSRKK